MSWARGISSGAAILWISTSFVATSLRTAREGITAVVVTDSRPSPPGLSLCSICMMKTLLILNEPAYGNERSYNGLRLALALSRIEGQEVRVFLMGDAVTCARTGQQTAEGYYNLERMIKGLGPKGVLVGCCGTCLEARGMATDPLVPPARPSNMAELAEWTTWADKVVTF